MNRKPPAAGKGRPKGSLNKATREIRAITQNLFDEDYFVRVKQRLLNGKLAPAVECKLLAYAFGEPKQQHEISGLDGEPIRQIINNYVVAAPAADRAPAR